MAWAERVEHPRYAGALVAGDVDCATVVDDVANRACSLTRVGWEQHHAARMAMEKASKEQGRRRGLY